MCGQAAEAAEPALSRAKLPAILPTATGAFLARRTPVLFRMLPADDRQAEQLAAYVARKLEVASVGVLYEYRVYGKLAAGHFIRAAKEAGIKVLGNAVYPSNRAELPGVLKTLAAGNPEAIFVAGDATMGAMVAREAAGMDLEMRFIGPSLMADKGLFSLGHDPVEGFILSEPFVIRPGDGAARGFFDRFRKRFGHPPGWIAAASYDALALGLTGLARSERSGKRLRHELGAMSTPERGFKGVTGTTWFDATGGSMRPLEIVAARGGSFIPAKVSSNE
jgi:branched-chain amino acid transport system substrate-binding protein